MLDFCPKCTVFNPYKTLQVLSGFYSWVWILFGFMMKSWITVPAVLQPVGSQYDLKLFFAPAGIIKVRVKNKL